MTSQGTVIELDFFRSNLLKLARAGFALVAGWGRHLTPVKQMAGTGGLARFNPQGS